MAEHLAGEAGEQSLRRKGGREGKREGREEGRKQKKGSSGHSCSAMCVLSCESGATYSADALSLDVN